MIRVAVIDDHGVVLMGLKFALSRDGETEVVATRDTAEGIVAFWEGCRPDVLLLDIRMPGISGTEALAELKKAHPEAKVAMLTTSDLEEDVYRAISSGAEGYIIKDARPDSIADAVKKIAAGGTHIPEEIRKLYDMRRKTKSLSDREVEILKYAARGLSYPDMAATLGISVNSVKTHVRRIFGKIGAADRTEAVTLAIARGIIEG